MRMGQLYLAGKGEVKPMLLGHNRAGLTALAHFGALIGCIIDVHGFWLITLLIQFDGL